MGAHRFVNIIIFFNVLACVPFGRKMQMSCSVQTDLKANPCVSDSDFSRFLVIHNSLPLTRGEFRSPKEL
jgi:hypothetical protein